jgi:hypothetical protein
MSNKLNKVVVLVIYLVFILSAISVQAQLTSDDENVVRAEITASLENYHHVFSTGTPAEMANQIYGAPLVYVSTNGDTTIWESTEEVKIEMSGFLNNLREKGWHHSSMPSPNICVLGPNSGFASGQLIRYREDDSEISRNGMAYVFQRKPEGWRMTTFLAHGENIKLSCQEYH